MISARILVDGFDPFSAQLWPLLGRCFIVSVSGLSAHMEDPRPDVAYLYLQCDLVPVATNLAKASSCGMALWTPSHEKECILPLNSLVPHPNANTVHYLNEEQRNVHIWNSLACQLSQAGSATQFQLIASELQSHLHIYSIGLPLGCWVEKPNRSVTTYELYRWLLSMCTPGGANPIQFLENTVNPQDCQMSLFAQH